MFSANSSQVSEDRLYVEDVFSTYLYAGTSTADNKITNGIDLAGKGGMVWLKSRTGAYSNYLTTNSTTTSSGGGTTWLYSDTTDALLGAVGNGLCNFFSDGFDINATGVGINGTGNNYASWTFREAPKFFDVVTYTGNGANRNIAHNLGVAPGCIIVKRTDAAADWQVYHRSNTNAQYMVLNTTAAVATGTTRWNSTTPTATEFTVGTDTTVNASGGTYVAYLFAHDTTSDGIIQCGSYTGNGSTNGPTVNLGWEPQWLLFKRADSVSAWYVIDNMRGMALTGNGNSLYPNLSGAENSHWSANFANINSTGFKIVDTDGDINASGGTYIYIAIRRGPMRTPTSGTSVFSPVATRTATGATVPPLSFTSNFPVDLAILGWRDGGLTSYQQMLDRLRMKYSTTSSTDAEGSTSFKLDDNNGMYVLNLASSSSQCAWMFRRAPSFFDEVCYTGTGSNLAVTHNLTAAPELMIVKRRDTAADWQVYCSALSNTEYLVLNTTAAKATGTTRWNSTTPGLTTFTVGTDASVNASGGTYVAYLFASCPGVSKVFSFTGNGTSQAINCGFSSGARFILIKRTDSTGNWVTFDSARGIVSGNDPSLLLNSTAAETNYDDIDPDSSGFIVNQSTNDLNVNGASYVGIAIS